MAVLNSADLHIGYRVHSHLYMLSQRKPTVLIAEDARGESQNSTLGLQNLNRDSSIEDINEYLSLIVDDPESLQPTIRLMRETFDDMQNFLKKLKAL